MTRLRSALLICLVTWLSACVPVEEEQGQGQELPTGHMRTTDNCPACHLRGAWTPLAQFDHNEVLDECEACHGRDEIPNQTVIHTLTMYDCAACHGVDDWTDNVMDHELVVGAYACAICHSDPQRDPPQPPFSLLLSADVAKVSVSSPDVENFVDLSLSVGDGSGMPAEALVIELYLSDAPGGGEMVFPEYVVSDLDGLAQTRFYSGELVTDGAPLTITARIRGDGTQSSINISIVP